MRTLVLSDLHLGTRTRRSVLRRPEPLAALLGALDGVDRLVLLGDLVELLEGHDDEALGVAEPVLRAIGGRMGAEREIVFVAGNHDYALIAPWLAEPGRSLSVDTEVPLDATPLLARVMSWLAPARVRVRYPGVWLGDGVWATHGHYVNTHLVPHEPWGALRRGPRGPAVPLDYNARPEAWLKRDVRQMVGGGAKTPGPAPPWFLRPLAPVATAVLAQQVRRAILPGIALVAERLGVGADVVLFGHVHRRGPLDGDSAAAWAPGGRPRILNTGSWLCEPLLMQTARRPNPYWPGGAIVLEDGAAPRSVGLLDGLDPDVVR